MSDVERAWLLVAAWHLPNVSDAMKSNPWQQLSDVARSRTRYVS